MLNTREKSACLDYSSLIEGFSSLRPYIPDVVPKHKREKNINRKKNKERERKGRRKRGSGNMKIELETKL